MSTAKQELEKVVKELFEDTSHIIIPCIRQ